MDSELSPLISPPSTHTNMEAVLTDSESDGLASVGDGPVPGEDDHFEVDPDIDLESELLHNLLSTDPGLRQVVPACPKVSEAPVQVESSVVDWDF
jgi:hypothetical protein